MALPDDEATQEQPGVSEILDEILDLAGESDEASLVSEPGPAGSPDEMLAQALADADKFRDMALRAEAEMQNMQRRTAREVENAHKYGERVAVETSKRDTSIEIAVTDNGPGIPEEELEKVFLPFHRVDSARGQDTGGIGLGLSVVQAVIDKHGGEIRLENQTRGGLKARIRLPA